MDVRAHMYCGRAQPVCKAEAKMAACGCQPSSGALHFATHIRAHRTAYPHAAPCRLDVQHPPWRLARGSGLSDTHSQRKRMLDINLFRTGRCDTGLDRAGRHILLLVPAVDHAGG